MFFRKEDTLIGPNDVIIGIKMSPLIQSWVTVRLKAYAWMKKTSRNSAAAKKMRNT